MIPGPKFGRDWQTVVLYLSVFVNFAFLMRVMASPATRTDPETGGFDLGYCMGYAGLVAVLIGFAVAVWIIADREEPEMKWGMRILLSIIPMAGLGFSFAKKMGLY